MTPRLREKAEVAKLLGMTLAAGAKPDRVTSGRIALLRALLASPDGTATIDDATDDLAAAYRDGGRWRGSVSRSLATAGITERAGVEQSDRPSRHRGYVARWRLVDRRKAVLLLSRLVAAQDCRVGLASAMPDTSPLNREAAPASFAEEPAGTASSQKIFPQFNEKAIDWQKEGSNGKTN